MKRYSGYLIDLDGTIYRGKERIPEAEEFINELIERNIPFKIVTNNATKSVDEIVTNLNTYYHLPVNSTHIYTSILAMGDYLLEHYKDKNIYVIGEQALVDYLEHIGISMDTNENIDVVVQALDRQLDYDKLNRAVNAILTGAKYIVTNTDRLIPTEEGHIPSSGAITAFIQFATRVEPIVIGKPNLAIMEGALDRLGIERSEVLMIGDNYDTDILAGINSSLDTLLVLTGITRREDLIKIDKQPTYIVNNLAEWQDRL